MAPLTFSRKEKRPLQAPPRFRLAATRQPGQGLSSARIKQARGLGPGVGTLRLLRLICQRLAVFSLGVFSVWLIVFVFRITDSRLPTLLALSVAYALAAYVILPRIVRMSLKILQRKSVPSFTLTGDGLPGDPVNLVLIGDFTKLRAAFAAAGWTEADPLNLTSSWRMIVAFVLNRPYPAAPFSTLFLFGRGQDVGFQKAIDMSPRKRHHVRFWALSLEQTEETLGTAEFWLNTDRPADEESALWVGAATKDIGVSFTRFTFQVTHATDADTNAERDLIVSELKAAGAIASVASHQAGERLLAGRVNHYVTDGEVAAASLA
jgi:LssY C-terminus